MGLTIDEDRKMLKEIHEVILGTYEKQGMLSRIGILEGQVASFKKVLIFFGTTIVGLIGEIIFRFIA